MKRLLALVALIVGQAFAPIASIAQENRGTTKPRVVRGERPRAPRPNQAVRPASHAVKQAQASIVLDSDYVVDSVHGDMHAEGCSSCDGGGCGNCSVGLGSSLCNTCNTPARFCICFPSHGWVSAEYLLWYQSGMRIPALATTGSATSQATAGVLGQATTRVLYGADEILDDESSGFRIRFGWWLSSFPGLGIEGEYTGLGEQTDSFFQTSNGTPVIARPFFNVLTGAEDSELVAFPNIIRGNLAVGVTSKLDGAAVRFRRQLCCTEGCGYSNFACQTVPTSSRIDATLGYRFWELDESLQTREQLTSLTTNQGTFDITDRFATRNQFNGAELGVLWQGRRGWWSLDALMRIGIGNVHQSVDIRGNSVITAGANPGVTTTPQTGFLAQSTNIGTYDRDKFTMVPELGLTAGYQLTKRVRLTAGYSLIYWGSVVRPGDQIDLNINPNLFAPQETTVSLPNRPQFQFVETDYWVQGLSFGGEFRW